MLTTYTLAELMEMGAEDLDQQAAFDGDPEGLALWLALWRAEREEVITDGETQAIRR